MSLPLTPEWGAHSLLSGACIVCEALPAENMYGSSSNSRSVVWGVKMTV
jgi:hypothetical protein